MILRVRCWLNLALNRVRQKVSLAQKSVQWKSPFGQKSVWLKSQFSHKSVQPATPLPQPHRVTCLWSPILALNIIQNCFIRMYCDSYYISFARRAPHLPRMKISLLRHDLLGEERWLISPRRRSKSLFLNGLLLGAIRTGIQVKLISHCQAVRIKQ